MAKQKRRKKPSEERHAVAGAAPSLDSDGLHAWLPGLPPSQATLDKMTKVYQENIRNSPLWDQMLRQFGEQEAERILRQFRVEVR